MISEALKSNLILFVLTGFVSLFAYLWTSQESHINSKMDKYDSTLQEILIASNTVSTQIASNRNEWELREGRILNALEKQALTIDRLLEITNRHNVQLVAMEQRINNLEKAMK